MVAAPWRRADARKAARRGLGATGIAGPWARPWAVAGCRRAGLALGARHRFRCIGMAGKGGSADCRCCSVARRAGCGRGRAEGAAGARGAMHGMRPRHSGQRAAAASGTHRSRPWLLLCQKHGILPSRRPDAHTPQSGIRAFTGSSYLRRGHRLRLAVRCQSAPAFLA